MEKIYRGMPDGAEKIEANFQEVKNKIDLVTDTGWINFPNKNTAFYRVMNNVLYLRFFGHNPVDATIGTLPIQYTPETPNMIDVEGWHTDVNKKARLQINGKNQGDPGKVVFISQNTDTLRTYLPGIPLG